MKMTVLYHSVTGNTKQMAEVIAEGMRIAENVEPKTFPIEEIDEAWAKESKCVILGTPIYYASVSGAVKSFLEMPCRKYELAGKIGGAFATPIMFMAAENSVSV
ncbi:MAG: NAD(P)H-dependent oxidoreductase [Oscillospiraceae bacterium]|nr:NAD(P)H-dependent oxidoreductase [Oscillospiraceae bacterium]